MARPSFSDIKNISKALLTQNDYVLNFGVVPGSGFTQSKEVLLKCVQVSLPPVEIETLDVSVSGFTTIHKGKKKFSDNSFSCDFFVSADTSLLGYNADAYQLIYNWMNKTTDTETGYGQSGQSLLFSGLQGMTQGLAGKLLKKTIGNIIPNTVNNTKRAYSVDNVTLNIYNVKGDLTMKVIIRGVFPTALAGLDLTNNQTEKQLLRIKATFAFDSYEVEDMLTTKALNIVNKQIDKISQRVTKKLPPAVKKFGRLI